LISEHKFNIYVIFPRNIIFIKFLHHIVLFYAAASSLLPSTYFLSICKITGKVRGINLKNVRFHVSLIYKETTLYFQTYFSFDIRNICTRWWDLFPDFIKFEF